MPHICSSLSDFELFVHIQETGDNSARELLMVRYDRLAVRLAGRFRHGGDPDLNQVARLGLLLAISRFDPHRGYRFTTFARPTINGELKRYLRDTAWSATVPRRLKDLRSPCNTATERLAQKLMRQPTTAELAEELGTDSSVVADVEAAGRTMVPHSLDHPSATPSIASGSGARMTSTSEEAVETAVLVRSALRSIAERDRQIVVWYFYENRTQGEIAEQLGISQAQVSRLMSRSMARLRTSLAPAMDPVGPSLN